MLRCPFLDTPSSLVLSPGSPSRPPFCLDRLRASALEPAAQKSQRCPEPPEGSDLLTPDPTGPRQDQGSLASAMLALDDPIPPNHPHRTPTGQSTAPPRAIFASAIKGQHHATHCCRSPSIFRLYCACRPDAGALPSVHRAQKYFSICTTFSPTDFTGES